MATGVLLNRTVAQGLMAKLVTAELARLKSAKTLSQAAWSEYEAEKAEASAIVYRAAANVSGLPEEYLAFGRKKPAAVLPDPDQDRLLTEQEIARAVRKADLETRDAATSRRPKKNRESEG